MRDGSFYKFWVYIIVSRTGTLYVGVTGYLARRIRQHKIESIEGFTKKYKVHRLVYYETYDHVVTAINREKQLKGWRRQKKKALVETTNPRWQDLAEQWGRRNAVRGSLWGKRPEFALLAIGIFGMFRLRRRIRSDSAQHPLMFRHVVAFAPTPLNMTEGEHVF